MNTNIVPTNTDKRVLRDQLLAERQAIHAVDKARQDQSFCHRIHQQIGMVAQPNQVIALYSPIRGEPDLSALMTILWAENFKVALPIVIEKNAPLKFAIYSPNDILVSHSWGILEPDLNQADFVRPDVMVIPCLGIHPKHYRLGYGGGFYDRTLAMYTEIGHQIHTIGVGYVQCEFEIDPFDLPLDTVFLSNE